MYDPIAHSARVLEETGAHGLFLDLSPPPHPLPSTLSSANIGRPQPAHTERREVRVV
jgi:hypothetical protein